MTDETEDTNPTAADLDAVAAEHKAAEATAEPQGFSTQDPNLLPGQSKAAEGNVAGPGPVPVEGKTEHDPEPQPPRKETEGGPADKFNQAPPADNGSRIDALEKEMAELKKLLHKFGIRKIE